MGDKERRRRFRQGVLLLKCFGCGVSEREPLAGKVGPGGRRA